MKKLCTDLKVVSVERITDHHVLLKLTSDEPLPAMSPGQFVEVKVDSSPETFLRRPISINYYSPELRQLWLLVAAVGAGTRRLCRLQTGDKLNCVLPLGNGFTIPDDTSKALLLIGGGVGVAPLLFYGKVLRERGLHPTFILGARTGAEVLEADLFKQYGDVLITTEDGSMGERGFVTNHSILQSKHFDGIATCGPKPMMKAVARFAKHAGVECEASLENMMACGLGACLCCVEKTTEGNLCVCKDGPVFNIRKLLWLD